MNAQNPEIRYKVHGQILDSRTGKELKRIPITVFPFNKVVDTDNKGRFLFSMPPGDYKFRIDYAPFDKKEIAFNLKSDTVMVIELRSPFTSQYLEGVEITAFRKATEIPTAIRQIDNLQLKALPALIGERDILKAFSLTAGVTASSEGAADMQVRGGLHGQNLYLLDGIPLYSTEHFFGLVSVYNPTIIKSAKLYKADFPAEYGGKISSVINVQTQDADLKKFKGEAEISLLTSKIMLNIPVVNDKLALSVAGRLSNYSLINLISPIIPQNIGTRFSFHFGDINTSLNWKISEKDKLKLSFFSNTDGIDVQNKMDNDLNKVWIKNKQQNGGLNWYKTFSEKAENHVLVYADNYGYDFGNSVQNVITSKKQIIQILTDIHSEGIVEKFRYIPSDKLNFNTGFSVKTFGFTPYQINQNDSDLNTKKTSTQTQLTEGIAYLEGDYKFARQQNLSLGLRFNSVGNQEKIYNNLEPRIGYHGIFKNDFSLSASIGKMTQPIHRVANSGLGFPFEMFFPTSTYLLPESSWNFSLGCAKDFDWNKRNFSIKVDAWYKTMNNIVEFQDGYDAVFSTIIAPQNTILDTKKYLTQGNGKAYGIDFSANYNVKNWSLTADYTLMKAECQFDQLNNGRPFAASTDIRNSISLTSQLKLSESWSFSATWQFNSGKPITVPTYIFANPVSNLKPDQVSDYDGTLYQRVITQRNNYRTKPFHKLDISFTHNYKAFKHYNATISLGVYNVYNNANPFMYYIDGVQNPNKTYKPVLKYMSLFPILPSFNWSLKF